MVKNKMVENNEMDKNILGKYKQQESIDGSINIKKAGIYNWKYKTG